MRKTLCDSTPVSADIETEC